MADMLRGGQRVRITYGMWKGLCANVVLTGPNGVCIFVDEATDHRGWVPGIAWYSRHNLEAVS